MTLACCFQDGQLKPEESYAWQPRRTSSASDSQDFQQVPTSSLKYTPMSTATGTVFSADTKPAVSHTGTSHRERGSGSSRFASSEHSRTNGSVSDNVFGDAKDDEVHLPSTQSPYITLLQKSRGRSKIQGLIVCRMNNGLLPQIHGAVDGLIMGSFWISCFLTTDVHFHEFLSIFLN